MKNIIFLVFLSMLISGCISTPASDNSIGVEKFIVDSERESLKRDISQRREFYSINKGKKVAKLYGRNFVFDSIFEEGLNRKVPVFVSNKDIGTYNQTRQVVLDAYHYCFRKRHNCLLLSRNTVLAGKKLMRDATELHGVTLLKNGEATYTIPIIVFADEAEYAIPANIILHMTKKLDVMDSHARGKGRYFGRGVKYMEYEIHKKISFDEWDRRLTKVEKSISKILTLEKKKQENQNKKIKKSHSQGLVFGRNAAKPGEGDSDKAQKILKSAILNGLATAQKDLNEGKQEQRKPPIYLDSDKKVFNEGKAKDRTKNVGVRADIQWGSVSKNLKEKGSTVIGKAFIPVQITGISSSKGNHTIKAEVELKIKLVDSCKNFGCGRRDITIDTYKETVTLKTSGAKKTKETIYFNDVFFGKKTDGIFTDSKKMIANPETDIRVTVKIISIK